MLNGKIRLLTTDNHGILRNGGGILWTSDDGLSFDQKEKGFHLPADYWPKDFKFTPKRHYGRKTPKFERPQVLMQDGHPTYLYTPSGTSMTGTSGTTSYVLKIK